MKWWIHPIFFWTLTVGLAGSNILNIQEELVIDNGGEGFSRIQSVAIGPDERVFVLDSREFCVYVFDSEGKLLMRFGRKGQGPGDLTRPFGIASITGGDLVVTERLNRASIFRADGSCRRILKLAVNNTGFFGDIVFAGPELFWGIQTRDDGTQVQRIVDEQGNLLQTELFEDPGTQIGVGETRYTYTHSAYSTYHFFSHLDDMSAAAVSTLYEIRLLNEGGRLLRTIRREEKATRFSLDERRVLERSIDKIENWSTDVKNRFKSRIPDRRSYISQIRLSPGRLWVFRVESDITDENAPVEVDLFKTDGTFLGRFSLPQIPYCIGRERMYLPCGEGKDILQLAVCRYRMME